MSEPTPLELWVASRHHKTQLIAWGEVTKNGQTHQAVWLLHGMYGQEWVWAFSGRKGGLENLNPSEFRWSSTPREIFNHLPSRDNRGRSASWDTLSAPQRAQWAQRFPPGARFYHYGLNRLYGIRGDGTWFVTTPMTQRHEILHFESFTRAKTALFRGDVSVDEPTTANYSGS